MQQGCEDQVSIQGPFDVGRNLNARLKGGRVPSGRIDRAGDYRGEGEIVQTSADGPGDESATMCWWAEESRSSRAKSTWTAGVATVPDFDSAQFDDSLTIDNPYHPLVAGTVYTYQSERGG